MSHLSDAQILGLRRELGDQRRGLESKGISNVAESLISSKQSISSPTAQLHKLLTGSTHSEGKSDVQLNKSSTFTATSFLNQNRGSWWLRQGKVEFVGFTYKEKTHSHTVRTLNTSLKKRAKFWNKFCFTWLRVCFFNNLYWNSRKSATLFNYICANKH